MKSNLETQAFKMTGLAREKFPQGKVGDTVKVRVPDIAHGSNNRSWYHQRSAKIGIKDGILNSLYTHNQFTTCVKVLLTSGTFHQLMFR